nr:protein FAR1-related sequence 11 [Tanacetum cinerariifolium]
MILLPFDLNEVPMEEDFVDEDIDEKENIDEPFVGQCFLSGEEASPSRWRRDELQLDDTSPTPHEEIITDLTCLNDAIDLVECPPKSIPKGRPHKMRSKGGIELIRQERHYGLCNGVDYLNSDDSDLLPLAKLFPLLSSFILHRLTILSLFPSL